MDIRTKLVLTLVSLSLISMALISAFSYQTSSELLRQISIRQLDALAESKARDLSRVLQGWKNQIRLIVSGPELRNLLRDLQDVDGTRSRRLIHLIEHAAESVENVEQIKITDLQGNSFVWGSSPDYGDVSLPDRIGEVAFNRAFLDGEGELRVILTSLLYRHDDAADFLQQRGNIDDDVILGHVEIVFNAAEISSVTENFTGLGETGEVLIVAAEANNSFMVLNPRRHKMPSIQSFQSLSMASEAIQNVLAGNSVTLEDFKDYRGKKVWGATRYLPELKWGLIVKVDSTEEERRADTLMEAMLKIGLALSAFSIIAGTLLGIYLARPIHELAVVVRNIRHGERGLRAKVKGDDEIAYLAESLNELLDYMETNMPSEDPNQDA